MGPRYPYLYPGPSRRAFTILELLVTTAMISLLVTILVAGVSGAKEAARRAVCLSHQKQIGQHTINFAAEHKWSMPWITFAGTAYNPGVLVCPSDAYKVILPPQLTGASAPLPVSYGFNPEYIVNRIKHEQIVPPSDKMVAFDGYGGFAGDPEEGVSGSGGATAGNLIVNGNKVVLTHIPPGNPDNAQVMEIALAALKGHIGAHDPSSVHVDLPGNWLVNGSFSIVSSSQNSFVRRHMYKREGNILFADGHAEPGAELLPSMFMFDDSVGLTGGNGGSGNGNGNGHGNSNGGGKGRNN